MKFLRMKKENAKRSILSLFVFFPFGILQLIFAVALFNEPLNSLSLFLGGLIFLVLPALVWKYYSRLAVIVLFIFTTYLLLLRLHWVIFAQPDIIGLVMMLALWVIALQAVRGVYALN